MPLHETLPHVPEGVRQLFRAARRRAACRLRLDQGRARRVPQLRARRARLLPLFFRYVVKDRISVSIGSLDETARGKPVNQDGIESRLPAFFELAGLPGETTEAGTPAEWLPRLVSRQHPDRD